jgi:hypothetical protein
MMADDKVIIMTRVKELAIFSVALFALAACGSEQSGEDVVEEGGAEEVSAEDLAVVVPDAAHKTDGKGPGATPVTPGSPYHVSYNIIGTPVVGSPITVDLRVESASGSRPVNLEYRIRDASSMMLAESQPARVRMEPAANERTFRQQVTVIPQREGRFYLNVSASFETGDGTISTVTAIPIQVGSGTRELQENGEIQIDENGEAVKVLTSE